MLYINYFCLFFARLVRERRAITVLFIGVRDQLLRAQYAFIPRDSFASQRT